MFEKLLPETYEAYRDKVNEVKSGNTDAIYLGAGAESTVWRVKNDGSDYVIKLANSVSVRGRPRDTRRATEGKIDAGIKGLGIKGLEQIIAASPQDGAAIYQHIEGPNMQYASGTLIRQVTTEQIDDLWQTVSIASRAGVQFDGWNDKGGNVFYSSTAGFTLIDYWSVEKPVPYEINRKYVIKSLGAYGLALAQQAPSTRAELAIANEIE